MDRRGWPCLPEPEGSVALRHVMRRLGQQLTTHSCGGSCRLFPGRGLQPGSTAFPFHPFARDHRHTFLATARAFCKHTRAAWQDGPIPSASGLIASESNLPRHTLDTLKCRATIIQVDVSFDPAKRDATLLNRGLDFADAGRLFAGRHISVTDNRRDYGEDRIITIGHLNGRCVVIVWTMRAGTRRIISMRHAHADEEADWFA